MRMQNQLSSALVIDIVKAACKQARENDVNVIIKTRDLEIEVKR